MVRYVIARHIADSDAFYKRKQVYPLAIKKSWFSKKVQIYKRRGYYDEMQEGTHRVFRDMDSFERTFRIIREDKHYAGR